MTEAMATQQKALDIRLTAVGLDHADAADNYNLLSGIHSKIYLARYNATA